MNKPERYYSLDVVRAVALLLGIVPHATVSFWPGFREANYPVSDDSPSAKLSGFAPPVHGSKAPAENRRGHSLSWL